MKIINTTPVIHVYDLQGAVEYYTTILGFSIDFEYGEYFGLNYGDLCIHLSGPTYEGRKKTAGSAHFCVYCDDVNDYYDTISKKGALISFPIGNRGYGLRDFSVNDADGNTLVFGMDIA